MNQIEKYFNAEKYESVIFVLVGIIAISVAIYFFIKLKQPFYNGMSYPLIGVALIQIIVGTSVYIRSPKDISRVNEIIQTDQSRIQTEEIPRMVTVMKNFNTYKWVEIALLVIGLSMFLYFPKMSLLKGIGLGLLIQSSFMLLLDFFAESRGKEYLEFLKSLS
jgi:MFS superfamily sulfate permease-like transporter